MNHIWFIKSQRVKNFFVISISKIKLFFFHLFLLLFILLNANTWPSFVYFQRLKKIWSLISLIFVVSLIFTLKLSFIFLHVLRFANASFFVFCFFSYLWNLFSSWNKGDYFFLLYFFFTPLCLYYSFSLFCGSFFLSDLLATINHAQYYLILSLNS